MVKPSNHDWVVVGRFGRAHGIKGWITLQSFTEPQDNILTYQPLHIQIKKTWCPIRILGHEMKGEKLLVQVEKYPSREDLSFLSNLDLAVPRSVLPKLAEDNFYLHDLIDLKVYNLDHDELGQVQEVMSTGASDILVILKGKTKILIPLIWDVFIKSIDLDKKQIQVDWEQDEH